MQRIHSDSGEVLIRISPLIDMTDRFGTNPVVDSCVPLHAKGQPVIEQDKQVELSTMHDFMSKLRQPDVLDRLNEYVLWQAEWRGNYAQGASLEDALQTIPERAPLSINLDLTTACNYQCDHCVDMDILNTGIRYEHSRLLDSITQLAEKGLRSVILIGGGEPTAYPKFEEVVRHLKSLDLKTGVVTNGSLMKKIHAVSDVLDKGDWVRLSLDSGSNETFRDMHKPGNKKCTLDWICEQIPAIKKANPNLQIGFSFIIVWDECETNDRIIIENLDEMYAAAERAKNYQFDYISYKPFLTRAADNNAEVVNLTQQESRMGQVMQRIHEQITLARQLENGQFRVVESTNLRVLENGTYRNFTNQPRNCHMQFFRQVLSPLGVFNCPVYRHVPQALLGGKHAYANPEGVVQTQKNTLRLIESFDASQECKDVTCLYNHANWFIEDLIQNPAKLDALEATKDRRDYFL